MPIIDVPEETAALLQPILDHLDAFQKQGRSGAAVDFSADEAELMSRMAALEAGLVGQMLRALDPTAPRVEVDGQTFRRMNNPNSEATYFAMRGPVRVHRALYRQEGVRNGPTVVPMELRAGIVEGHLTPAAARGIAAVGQGLPSREGETTCRRLGVLPYSRSEHFRAAVAIGARWGELREIYENELAETFDLPPEATAVSVAVDRVSLPMAEARAPTADDVRRGIRNPITVQFRMAFAAVVTVYSAAGRPLGCIRYAHVPTSGAAEMEDALREDLNILQRRRPDLEIVGLADGAPEMQSILDRVTAGHEVRAILLDFWHLLEHLGQAARAADEDPATVVPRFRRTLLDHDDAIRDVEAELLTWAMRTPGQVPEDLKAALTYIANHRDRMRYATVHAAGLPIGSGTVEATGKTIVETRMRRAGARWDEAGAQPILNLRALATSSGTRWAEALDHLVDSYTADVTPLPAKSPKGPR